MQLEEVKEYLKIDFDDDDTFLGLLIGAAREYVVEAVGECDETKARVKLLMLVLIADMYEKRTMTVSGDNSNSKTQYIIRSIINQLSCGDDEEGSDDG